MYNKKKKIKKMTFLSVTLTTGDPLTETVVK